MRALKSFFKNYKDGLNAYQTTLSNAVKKLTSDLELPVFAGGVSQIKSNDSNESFGRIFDPFKEHLDQLTQHIEDKNS
jgi:hypothetical protein